MVDLVGQHIGQYRLLRLIGTGSKATMYMAEHISLKKLVAIKVLNRGWLEKNEEETFLREADITANLMHPHILRTLEVGAQNGYLFEVIDYTPNGTLRQRHPTGTQVPLDTVVSYVNQVADALQYIHDNKLIHRDVKSHNMFIGLHNEILLGDFGLAIVAQGSDSDSAQTVMGTPAYMAPEQWRGEAVYSSDQYALGIVVYEWLSGSLPFNGSFEQLMFQHMYSSPPPLHERIPTIPPLVEEVLMIALAKNPRNRFASVHAFANAFEQASQHNTDSIAEGLLLKTDNNQPYLEAIQWIKQVTNLPYEKIAHLIGVFDQIINRWEKGEPITDNDRQRILAVRDVLERATHLYPTPAQLANWLDTPRGAEGRTPAELLEANEIDKARYLAISTPSPDLARTPEWVKRPIPEAFRAGAEHRQEALPPEKDDELAVLLEDEDEDEEVFPII